MAQLEAVPLAIRFNVQLPQVEAIRPWQRVIRVRWNKPYFSFLTACSQSGRPREPDCQPVHKRRGKKAHNITMHVDIDLDVLYLDLAARQ